VAMLQRWARTKSRTVTAPFRVNVPAITLADVQTSINGGGWPTSTTTALQRYAKYSQSIGNQCFQQYLTLGDSQMEMGDGLVGYRRVRLLDYEFDPVPGDDLFNLTYASNLTYEERLEFAMDSIYMSDNTMELFAGTDPYLGDWGYDNGSSGHAGPGAVIATLALGFATLSFIS